MRYIVRNILRTGITITTQIYLAQSQITELQK